MKFSTVFLLFLCLGNISFAQSDSTFSTIFDHSHHSVLLGTGLNRSAFTPATGAYVPQGANGLIFKIAYRYTYNFSERIGLHGSAGIGVFPEIYHLPAEGEFMGTQGWRYFQLVSNEPFTEVSLIPEVRVPLNSNYLLNINGGISRTKLHRVLSGSGYSVSDTLNQTFDVLDIEFRTAPKAVHSITLGGGIIKKLKNLDLLQLNIAYQYSFANFFKGAYYAYPPLLPYSTGNYFNKGNSLNLSLNYVFTRTKKRLKKEELAGGSENKNKAWREYKIRSRPLNAWYATATFGLAFGINKSHDKAGYLLNSLPVSVIGSAAVIKEFKEKIFVELGINHFQYWSGVKYNPDKLDLGPFMGSGWGSAFISLQTNLGAGYRLITLNKRPIMNLHSGVGVGATVDYFYKGRSGGSGGAISNADRKPIFYFNSADFKYRNFFPLVYGGISRDMRISNNLYFVAAYRYNQGFLKIEKQFYRYAVPAQGIENRAIASINGSYHSFQIGLKFKIAD